jgi:hypothetical protein
MGHYNGKGQYVYSSLNVGNGGCSPEHYYRQRQTEQKKLDANNAGEVSSPVITSEEASKEVK